MKTPRTFKSTSSIFRPGGTIKRIMTVLSLVTALKINNFVNCQFLEARVYIWKLTTNYLFSLEGEIWNEMSFKILIKLE